MFEVNLAQGCVAAFAVPAEGERFQLRDEVLDDTRERTKARNPAFRLLKALQYLSQDGMIYESQLKSAADSEPVRQAFNQAGSRSGSPSAWYRYLVHGDLRANSEGPFIDSSWLRTVR